MSDLAASSVCYLLLIWGSEDWLHVKLPSLDQPLRIPLY